MPSDGVLIIDETTAKYIVMNTITFVIAITTSDNA